MTHNTFDDLTSAWSPDGTRIALESRRDGNTDLYLVARDGSDEVRMTRNDAQDRDPDWAPDGSQLAFQSHRHGWNIYVKDLQHGPTARLIHGPAIDWAPKWAPDGTKIAYTRLGLLHQRLDLETLASWSHASKQLASLRAAPSQATV